MPKFKLTWERSQNGKIFTDWTNETIVETYREPQIGEGRSLLVDPPIHEYIIKVEKADD